jgi:hypothetical protein
VSKRDSEDTLYVNHVGDSLSGLSESPKRFTWFGKLPYTVLTNRALEPIDWGVYAVIALHARKCEPVMVGSRLIARILNVSQMTVVRSLKRLEAGREIIRSGGKGQRTTYEFTSCCFKHVDNRGNGEIRVTGYSGVPIHAGAVPESVPPVKSAPRKWREQQAAAKVSARRSPLQSVT